MARMHRAMAASPTGDPDRDFAAMMIPHHQGAVEMAEAELRFGKDERLRRLAQGIIVEQRQEIAVMRQVLDTLPSAPLPPAARRPAKRGPETTGPAADGRPCPPPSRQGPLDDHAPRLGTPADDRPACP